MQAFAAKSSRTLKLICTNPFKVLISVSLSSSPSSSQRRFDFLTRVLPLFHHLSTTISMSFVSPSSSFCLFFLSISLSFLSLHRLFALLTSFLFLPCFLLQQKNDGGVFSRLGCVMNEILDLRRQVLVGHLTHDRMRDVKQHITARLDWGNEWVAKMSERKRTLSDPAL